MPDLGEQGQHHPLGCGVARNLEVPVEVDPGVVAGYPGEHREVGFQLQGVVAVAIIELGEGSHRQFTSGVDSAARERGESPVAVGRHAQNGILEILEGLVDPGEPFGEVTGTAPLPDPVRP